jgi:hypothetical protein
MAVSTIQTDGANESETGGRVGGGDHELNASHTKDGIVTWYQLCVAYNKISYPFSS